MPARYVMLLIGMQADTLVAVALLIRGREVFTGYGRAPRSAGSASGRSASWQGDPVHRQRHRDGADGRGRGYGARPALGGPRSSSGWLSSAGLAGMSHGQLDAMTNSARPQRAVHAERGDQFVVEPLAHRLTDQHAGRVSGGSWTRSVCQHRRAASCSRSTSLMSVAAAGHQRPVAR